MDCSSARVGLSTRMDDEPVPDPAATLDHLRECVDCVDWLRSAERVDEEARKRYVTTPDLTEPVLRRIGEHERRIERRRRTGRLVVRGGIAVAATAQLVLALPALFTVSGHGFHAGRELASLDVAIAVGFLAAAIRPEWARALLPTATVLAVCLALTSVVDIAAGTTSALHEALHLTALVPAVLLWTLSGWPPRSSRRVASAG